MFQKSWRLYPSGYFFLSIYKRTIFHRKILFIEILASLPEFLIPQMVPYGFTGKILMENLLQCEIR
jgi:hypothetical protein